MFGFSTTDKISWLGVLLWSFVPLGQLWVRIFNFKGSLDKPWMLLPFFLFPPLSLITMVMIKFGFIQDGKGSEPVDKVMLLPLIAKFAIPFILPYLIDDEEGENEQIIYYISLVLQFLMVVVAMMTRRYINCNSITFDSFGKASIDSLITYGFANLVPMIMGWVPFIGIVVTALEMIAGDFVNDILWSFGFIASYALVNMFNQEDMNAYCNAPFFGYTKDQVLAGISIVISVLSNFL
jgi:hypothetical protein